jgi:hypothetical protein
MLYSHDLITEYLGTASAGEAAHIGTYYCPYGDRCQLDALVEAIVASVLLTHDFEV